MERDEALGLLRGGPASVAEWNRRRQDGEVFKDLDGADLSGALLIRADLSGVNLIRANLSGADLSGANLRQTRLSEADLSGANLRQAHLIRTDLSAADLSGAVCVLTEFSDLDMKGIIGLELVEHYGPSTIGTDTLFRSQGKIPEVFLQRCGVPDSLIAYLPDLIGSMSPIQFYSCFISHSSRDAEFVARLDSRMRQAKLRVWCSARDMRGGRRSIDQIDQAIRVHDKLLLVLSKASMVSDWVKHEIIKAVEREKSEKRPILFPIGLVSRKTILGWTAFDSDLGRDLAKVVREYHIPDFSRWKGQDAFEGAFVRLLDDLKLGDGGVSARPAPGPA